MAGLSILRKAELHASFEYTGLEVAYTACKNIGKSLVRSYLQDQLVLSYLHRRVVDVGVELILPPISKSS